MEKCPPLPSTTRATDWLIDSGLLVWLLKETKLTPRLTYTHAPFYFNQCVAWCTVQELQRQSWTPFTLPNISCVSRMAHRCCCLVDNLKQECLSTHLYSRQSSILLPLGVGCALVHHSFLRATDNLRVDSQPCQACLWNAAGSRSSWIEPMSWQWENMYHRLGQVLTEVRTFLLWQHRQANVVLHESTRAGFRLNDTVPPAWPGELLYKLSPMPSAISSEHTCVVCCQMFHLLHPYPLSTGPFGHCHCELTEACKRTFTRGWIIWKHNCEEGRIKEK